MDKQLLVTYGIPALGVLLALLLFVFALHAGRRQRLVSDVPTCKATGVFIGLVEVKGTAEAEEPLVSYLAETRCVSYHWQVDEHWSRIVVEHYTDSAGKSQTRTRIESGWTTVAHGGEEIPFYLKDDCGVILIRPEKAKVEPRTVFDHTCDPAEDLYYGKGPSRSIPDSMHRRRFVESAIPLHAELYVIGQARERDDVVAPEIAYDPRAEMFLITTHDEDQVRSGLAGQFWLCGIFAVVLGLGGFLLADGIQHHPLNESVPKYVLVGALLVLAWFLGWFGMVYNSLIALRQRVRQACSNVDVQLKRRHDLIPNLVEIVKGMRDYERTVQTELAYLRTQSMATPPGEPGPDPRAASAVIGAIVERYPQLESDGSFRNLHRNLVDTEQRIALARAYFNEIATFYNTRLERIPDRFIAALHAAKPQALMTTDQFERAPVEVHLAT
jgi:hypothetical protein